MAIGDYPLANPWTSGEEIDATKMQARVTAPINDLASILSVAPLGVIGHATGPETTTDANTTGSVIVSLAVSVTAGRRYRVSASAECTKLTAAGTATVQMKSTVETSALTQWRAILASLASGDFVSGSGFGIYDATATETETFTLTSTASAGALRSAVNSAQILVEDIGVTP